MTYPNFENKHLEEALFSARDYIKYRSRENMKFPKKFILLFQNSAERYIKRQFKLKKDKEKSPSKFNMYIKGNIGFIKSHGIGAPNAVTILEEMIAVGGKEFILVGTAGGLQSLGVFICNKAIRDEGTSYHYISHGKFSFPDKQLTEKLKKEILKKGLNPVEGATWTIDAPYRETTAEINHYKKEGVKTVEMEAAALFAVAEVRKVKIAAAFSVSDIVGEQAWKPQMDKKPVKRKLNQLVDAAVDCLEK